MGKQIRPRIPLGWTNHSQGKRTANTRSFDSGATKKLSAVGGQLSAKAKATATANHGNGKRKILRLRSPTLKKARWTLLRSG
jgi:hypothetical protein